MISWKEYQIQENLGEIVFRKNDQSADCLTSENGFFYRGLFQYNKNTEDYFHNPVLAVCLKCEKARLPLFVQVELTLEKLVGNFDVHCIPVVAHVCMTQSVQWFYIRKEDFSLPLSRAREYRFVRQIRFSTEKEKVCCDKIALSNEIEFSVKELYFQKSDGVSLRAPVRSKMCEPGEILSYPIEVENESRQQVLVHLFAEDDGWKELSPRFQKIKLQNLESQCLGKDCWLSLKENEAATVLVTIPMSDTLAPGGSEKFHIHANWSSCESGSEFGTESKTAMPFTLYALRKLSHPCVIFDKALLEQIRKKIQHANWAKSAYDKAYTAAEEWTYPSIDKKNDYLFDTAHAHHARDCAIVYQISGEIRFAEKVAAFLREWGSPDGYRRLPRAGNQELVHDGEFFKSAATAYDLIYDWAGWTAIDQENIEATMRFYMEYIDAEICSGEASNWLLAEIAGAVYCAAVLGDKERMERFLYGPGGASDQLAKGVLDDGWWYEASIGYNLMCAGLMSELALAAAHFGMNFKDIRVSPAYRRTNCVEGARFDGLSNDIWGENTKNTRSIEMLWDSLIPFYDYRGVVMGINDSSEQKSNAQTTAFYKLDYELAYLLYHKPEYAYMISRLGDDERNVLFGEEMRPAYELDELPYEKSCYAQNAGSVVLRSHKKNRPIREQIQVGLKYGSHGGAHGHYDRASMNGLMRYGRSLTNPENIWYSYHTFMYKFYCQTSINHNMVTVDLKQQEAAQPKQLLFYSGDAMQVFGVENNSRWSYPPYGGWPVGKQKTIEERQWMEGRSFPIPENHPEYAVRSGFTEPVITRRVTVLTDDYVVNFDYATSGQPEAIHDFQCIYHLQGLTKVDDALSIERHTAQLSDDPLGSAQFITDCDWYEKNNEVNKGSQSVDGIKDKAAVKFQFHTEYAEKKNNFWRYDWKWQNRTAYNEYGTLDTDLYFVPMKQDDSMQFAVACPPEFALVNKRLYWKVCALMEKDKASGEQEVVLAEGKFGAWILGKETVDVALDGVKKLYLKVFTEDGRQGDLYEYESLKTIFWGDPVIETADHQKLAMADLAYLCENTDEGCGVGKDYEGGRVTIQAEAFDKAIPAEPKDKRKWGIITLDLEGLNATNFHAVIGGDYPVGDESGKRRTIFQQQTGTSACFASVIEPHEGDAMVQSVQYAGPWSIKVTLADGREQIISVNGIENTQESDTTKNSVRILLEEYQKGTLIRSEDTLG